MASNTRATVVIALIISPMNAKMSFVLIVMSWAIKKRNVASPLCAVFVNAPITVHDAVRLPGTSPLGSLRLLIIIDKFGGNVSLSSDLFNFKSCFNFVDAWRSKHPRVSQCSWLNSNLTIGSQLDSFLVAHDLINSLLWCEISPCVFSDHEFVTLDVNLSHVFDFGPGVWKFNNFLLEDCVYCALITDLIDQHLGFKHIFVSVKEFWESLKFFALLLLIILELSEESFRVIVFGLRTV